MTRPLPDAQKMLPSEARSAYRSYFLGAFKEAPLSFFGLRPTVHITVEMLDQVKDSSYLKSLLAEEYEKALEQFEIECPLRFDSEKQRAFREIGDRKVYAK